MFKPKKFKGGSYTSPVDPYGLFPTTDELFLTLEPTLTTSGDIFNTTEFIENSEFSTIKNTTINTLHYYSTMAQVYSQQSSLLVLNNVVSTIELQTQQNLYNQLSKNYSKAYTAYQSSIQAYEMYSTLEALSISRYNAEYGKLINGGTSSDSFINSLENYVNNLPDENIYNLNVAEINSLIFSYKKMYIDNLNNVCTLSSQLISELSTIQNLYNISSSIEVGPYDNQYLDSLQFSDISMYSDTLFKMLQNTMSTQQALYLYEASSLILHAKQEGYHNICSESIKKLAQLGGTYDVTTAPISGGGTDTTTLINIISTAFQIYPDLQDDIINLLKQNGQLQYLESISSSQISTINNINMHIKSISSQTLMLGVSSTRDLQTQLNTKAHEFYQQFNILNNNLSTQFYYEIQSYINNLQSLSSFLISNLLENRLEAQNISYSNFGITNTNVSELSTTRIQILSTNSQDTHSLIYANSTFIAMLNAEAFIKNFYIQQKSAYESQSYYSLVSDPKYNPSNFQQVTNLYSLSIQNVNRYVKNRESYYNNFMASLNKAISNTVIQPDISYQLTQTYSEVITTSDTLLANYNVPAILPLQMKFNYVSPFSTLFQERSMPPEVMLSCPSIPITYESNVEDRINLTLPTIIKDTTVHGVQGQYISIQRQDNDIEILQILVIDSTGKNVAYDTSVSAPSIIPSTTTGPTKIQPLSVIVNGNYDTTSPQNLSFISGPTETATVGIIKTIWIDLGEVCDITAIQYLKSDQSPYNSVGFTFQIYAADQITPVSKPKTTIANTTTEILDFRKVSDPTIPISLVPLRKGLCGVLARYVTIAPSSSQILQISQVTIVSSDGTNLALQTNPVYISGVSNTTTSVPYITDGSYYSRPLSSCFNLTNIPIDSYIEFDLGTEMDITAVQLYNTNTEVSYQFGTVISLFTDDNQLAISKMAVSNNTKEVIDFRFPNSDLTCPIEMNWSSYYGVAGIITQYIGLQKTDASALGFSKIQIIDKSGRDVGLYQPTLVSSAPDKSYLGVTNYETNKISSISYVSNKGPPNQLFVVDLQKSYEICAINILACSDGPDLLENTTLNFYDKNPFIATDVNSFYTKPVNLTNLSCMYDTRYDPENSTAPTSVDASKSNYGPFGTMAISAMIPGNYTNIKITEATGLDLYPTSIISTIGSSTLIVFNSSSNIFEINSIIIDDVNASIGLFITLYGCDDVVVNKQPLQLYNDTALQTAQTFKLADFRNPLKKSYAPMEPLPSVRYSDLTPGSTEHTSLTAIYSEKNVDTGKNNMPPKGLLAQYIKIVPRDSVTPLYISQIVAVDSNGMNIAFEKETYTPNTSIAGTTGYAVDGVYAVSPDDPKYDVLLSLADYISRETTSSFVSVAGPQEQNYLVINLGMEYFVNSIIYVASKGNYDAGLGVIVELYDSNLNRVGIRVVSQYISLFGADVLDFRVDRSELVSNPGAWLEVRPCVVQLGESCGMMAQYIRVTSVISGSPFQLSQLIVTDSNGNNIALYKPVYSSTNQNDAYKIVDGTYYQRLPQYAYTSVPQNDPSTDYIEVNFGNEVALMNLYMINTLNAENYSLMKIQIYNRFRDLIATLNLSNTNYMNLPLNNNNFFTPSVLNNSKTIPVYNTTLPVLGVNILTKLSPFLVTGGILSETAMPTKDTPPTDINQTFPLEALCDDSPPVSANLNNKFTRGPNNEVPGRFIRVYNVNKYIQVSQIMVYGSDGTNYAYKATATSKSVFPGTYVATVTDGDGGYFHTPRPCAQCFKSAGKRYDFLQVDLGTTYQIAGVRCIFASDDQGQNIGASIQILNEQDGAPDAILARHTVGSGEYEEALVDFRYPAGTVTIAQIIMPKIFTLPNLPTGISGPNGMTEGSDGTLYIVDTMNHCIWSSTGLFYGTVGKPTQLSYPVGITTDGIFFYVSDFGNNRIVRLDASANAVTYIASVNNPYGILYKNGNIFCTSYNTSGNVYVYNSDSLIKTFSTGIPYPNSIVVSANTYYVTSATTGTVYTLDSNGAKTPYISSLNTTPVTLPLKSTSAIAYDSSENILFISDYIQDKIFAVQLGMSRPTTYSLAGTGNGGYSGDGLQGVLATMDGPMGIIYSQTKGFLYISDYKNSTIRYLELYSKPPASYSTTTSSPAWFGWTTETLGAVTFTIPPTPTIQALTKKREFTQIVKPATISTVFNFYIGTDVTAFYITNSKIYCAVNNSMRVISLANNIISSINTSVTFGKITCITGDSNYLYICDSTHNLIYRMSYDGSNPTKFVGSDKTANSLSNPTWIGFDNNGTFYVSDTGNYCIRRINGFGELEVYAGQAGVQGTTATNSGTNYGVLTSLSAPGPFIFDSNNFMLFIDGGSNTIYQISSDNRMTPICPGGSNMLGWVVTDTGTLVSTTSTSISTPPVEFIDTYYKLSEIPNNSVNVKLRNPSGITMDASGSIYVTASAGQQIVEFTFNNFTGIYTPTIIAGFGSDTVGRINVSDTIAEYASLNNPRTLQIYNNKLYFLENNVTIRNITFEATTKIPLNTVIPYGPLVYIGNNTKNTYNTSAVNGMNETTGILEQLKTNFTCCSSVGTVYLGNNISGSGTIISIDLNNVLSVITKGLGIIQGIVLYSDSVLYIADSTNNVIISIVLSSFSITNVLNVTGIYALALNPIGFLFYSYGKNVGCYNLKDSSGVNMSISSPENVLALAVDSDGNVYVSTATKIYKYIIKYSSSKLTVSTNIVLPLNKYGGPYNGMTFYDKNLYFSSSATGSVVFIPVLPSIGTPVVIVGQNSIKGPANDGSYSNTVSLNQPMGLCMDINRNLFILDTIPQTGQSTLLRNTNYISLEGGLTYTIAGTNTVGSAGDYLSNTFAYLELFNNIGGVCYDSLGQMYVSDTGNHCISIIDLSGMIATYVGTVGTPGYNGDGGLATLATLNSPGDIKMSQSNVLYIADTGNNCIRRVKIYNDGYHIETFGKPFSSPSCIAIDSNENIFIVYSNSPIQITNTAVKTTSTEVLTTTAVKTTTKEAYTSSIGWITPTEQIFTFYTANYAIGVIAFNSSDQLFYTTSDSVYRVPNTESTHSINSNTPIQILTGLSNPMGLYFDTSDNLYVSDTGNNKVYQILAGSIPVAATPITHFTVFIGNGLIEPIYTNIPSVAQNIRGYGTYPTKRALYAPGPISFDPVKGILIGQPTKITLYNLTGTQIVTTCGINTNTVQINNVTGNRVYISQIVVLDNNGMNIALGSEIYQDGFYGCKPTTSAYAISAGSKLTFDVTGEIVCILLYIGLDGNGYTKPNWGGVQLTIGDITRTIQNITDSYSLQYITFDYRKKTPACLPFNDYINKYKLQTSPTILTSSYTQSYIRYIRIIANTDFVSLSQVAIIHADTGTDLGPNSIMSASNSSASSLYTDSQYYTQTKPVSTTDTWIEFDLGDEYPIDQVILYTNNTTTYTLVSYTNTRTQVQLPTVSIFDPLVAFIRFYGDATVAQINITDLNSNQVTLSSVTGTNYVEYRTKTPTYIENITIISAASNTLPCKLVFYNQSRVVIYVAPVLFQNYTLSPNISSVVSYSFTPIVGTKQVRYIQYKSNGVNPIQISQILAIDVNGINVAYNKSAISPSIVQTGSTNTLTNPYTTADSSIQIDLGEEYELIEVIYVNASQNQSKSTGCQIALNDALGNELSTYTLLGTFDTETFDTRTPEKYISLTYSPTASIDPVFTSALCGRYIRFENPVGNSSGFTIRNLAVYDIYGKCISVGKTTLVPVAPIYTNPYYYQKPPVITSSSQNALNNTGYTNANLVVPGDWWEIDLGQTYSIKDIVVNASLSLPYVVYDFYRGEIYRSFTSGSVSTPLTLPTNPPVSTNTQSVRFIRISGTGGFALTHVAAIDSRGMDVCVWKSGRLVDGSGNVSYVTLDGRYSTAITVSSVFDIDLGKSYDICSLICYGSGSGYTITTYTSSGTIITEPTSLTSNPQTIELGGAYTSVQNTLQYGKKTRYVLLNGLNFINFNTVAVIDSLGRNVAYNSVVTFNSSGSNYTIPYDLITSIQLNSIQFVQIDLGQEYYIAFVSVYSSIPSSITVTKNLQTAFDTSMMGTTVTLMDSIMNTSGTTTLTGSGSTYNILYPMGNIFNRSSANPNITNISVTSSDYTSGVTSIGYIEMIIDPLNNKYLLQFSSGGGSQNALYLCKPGNVLPISQFSATNTNLPSAIIYCMKLYANFNTQKYYYISGSYSYSSAVQQTPLTIGFFGRVINDTNANTWIFKDYIAQLGLNEYLPTILKFVLKNNYAYFLTANNIYRAKYTDNSLGTITLGAIEIFITFSTLLSGKVKNITVDSKNNIYVSWKYGVYKYATDTTFTTATPISYQKYLKADNTEGFFKNPYGLCVDENDYVFVADTDNHSIRVISPTGTVNTVLGTGFQGNVNGDITAATFDFPSVLALDSTSKLYVVNGQKSYLRTITISSVPNTNLPFISNIATTHIGTYPLTSSYSTGVQTYNNNLVGTSFLEICDFT